MAATDPLEPALCAALARTRLLVLDVDGTLTDGGILVLSAGGEAQRFDVRDGIAIKWLQAAGVRVAWITGRGGEGVARRARELGVEDCLEHVADKRAALEQLQRRLGLTREQTCAMGDDLPDLGLFAAAVFRAAPADAQPELRARAHWVAREAGGAGAVRALAELILRSQGRWDGLVEAAAR